MGSGSFHANPPQWEYSPHEKPSMSHPYHQCEVGLGLSKKFVVRKHLFSLHRAYYALRLKSSVCNFDCEAERVSTLIFLCILLRSPLNTSIWTDFIAKPGLPCIY